MQGESFNLFQCLNNNDNDDFSILNDHSCPYITNDQYNESLGENMFSILSINIRSLSGKITELSNFLHNSERKFLTDCVAIQEVWNIPADTQFNINGYHPFIYKTRDTLGLSS